MYLVTVYLCAWHVSAGSPRVLTANVALGGAGWGLVQVHEDGQGQEGHHRDGSPSEAEARVGDGAGDGGEHGATMNGNPHGVHRVPALCWDGEEKNQEDEEWIQVNKTSLGDWDISANALLLDTWILDEARFKFFGLCWPYVSHNGNGNFIYKIIVDYMWVIRVNFLKLRLMHHLKAE